MVRRIAGIAAALALVAALAGVALPNRARVAHATAPAAPMIVSAESTDAPTPVDSSMQLSRSADLGAIDSEAAVAKVRDETGSAFMAKGTSIVVGKYRIDDEVIPEAVLAKNALVWVVTLNGVESPVWGQSAGGKTKLVAHQMNFVVDATTGALVFHYAGMVGPQ
jgi:hypothetical protein